jgi:hypothetical protein
MKHLKVLVVALMLVITALTTVVASAETESERLRRERLQNGGGDIIVFDIID